MSKTSGFLALILGRANATAVSSAFEKLSGTKETKPNDRGEISQSLTKALV